MTAEDEADFSMIRFKTDAPNRNPLYGQPLVPYSLALGQEYGCRDKSCLTCNQSGIRPGFPVAGRLCGPSISFFVFLLFFFLGGQVVEKI